MTLQNPHLCAARVLLAIPRDEVEPPEVLIEWTNRPQRTWTGIQRHDQASATTHGCGQWTSSKRYVDDLGGAPGVMSPGVSWDQYLELIGNGTL